jgi:hypothetical protein
MEHCLPGSYKLYVDNGFYKEHLVSLLKKEWKALQQISQMIDLRENPLKEINMNV